MEVKMINAVNKNQDLLNEYDNNERLYKSFLGEIEHQVKSLLEISGVTVNAITSRFKTRDSLKGKIERKSGKYEAISDITDIVGIRIITYFSEDVDKVAEIIESEFDVDVENSIDKRESLEPDRFGYCSLHYVVKMNAQRLSLRECSLYKDLKCEIQIRSILQHAWAEIEHDIGYKSEITVPREMRRSFSRIAGLLEIADKEFNDIRTSLLEYKINAQQNIATKEFMDREIDAVILETLANQDPNIKHLNDHIAELMGTELHSIEDFDARSTIQELKVLNITTVKQLTDVIQKYTSMAYNIASEYLKDYDPDDNGRAAITIAYFYLCYAILLSDDCKIERIENYLEKCHIGIEVSKREFAVELYNLAKKLNDKI